MRDGERAGNLFTCVLPPPDDAAAAVALRSAAEKRGATKSDTSQPEAVWRSIGSHASPDAAQEKTATPGAKM